MLAKLEQYKVIWTREKRKSVSEVFEEEYLKALIDYYSSYMTRLASTHERKLIVDDSKLLYTTIIAPFSQSCPCYGE
jgi:hypothetical protein